MTKLNSLILLVGLLFVVTNTSAQSCQSIWTTQSGSISGEKLFSDNSLNATSITLLTPGAIPASTIFLPGETVSVIFPTSGSHTITYIASNPSTSCSDSVVSSVQTCLISPPIVSIGTNPGEFTVTDPAINSPGESGSIQFNLAGGMNSSITGTTDLYYPTTSTTLVSNSNGPHAFWYHTYSGSGSCYDSILVSFDITNVTSCQAGIAAYPATWISAGAFYLYDQSANNSFGTFNCVGATPSIVNFSPWNGTVGTSITFSANGSYPYTYVTYDSISNCTDSINGVINVTGYPLPCTLQAGVNVTYLNPNPQYYHLSDNSINFPGVGTLAFTPDPGINSYSTSIFSPGNYALSFNSNGVYYYSYTITDGPCSSTINDSIVVFSYPSGSPCQADVEWVVGPGPGQVTLTDVSTNYTTGTFYCADAIPQTSIVVPGGSTIIEFSANASFQYVYSTENSGTACTDSILAMLTVTGVPCPPMSTVQWSTTNIPGEVIFQDLNLTALDWSSVRFLNSSNGFLYPTYLITPGDSTYASISANGTYVFSYKIYNSQTNCVDSILDSLVISSFTGCQAGLTYSESTPGIIQFSDQSTNVQLGELFCIGAVIPTYSLTINPINSQNYGSIEFATNGTYPYTYVTHNTATGCSDTITGFFIITGFPTPCTVQAGLTITPGVAIGEFLLTDNSTGGAASSYFEAGNGLPAIAVLPNSSASVNYSTNGAYSYVYTVYDSVGMCPDTLFGTLFVLNFPLPCATQALLTVNPGSNPGGFTLIDSSLNASNGTFYSTNSSGVVTLSSGASVAIDYTSNGWHAYTYIVFDSTGVCSDTLLGSIYVSGVNCGVFAGLIIVPTANAGEYTLTDNSTAGTYSYFHSGISWVGAQILPNNSITFSYPSDGTYDYKYVVYDSVTLCSDSLVGTLVVTGVIPPSNCSASFTLFQDTLNASQYYCWNTAVNSTGGTSGLDYLWDFGDGSTSTQAYPTHTYGSLGDFILCLTITEPINGCVSVYCDTVAVIVKASGTTINVLPPGANVGLEEQAIFSSITVYPNPSDGNFTLNLESKRNSVIELQIVSVSGQVLFMSDENLSVGTNEIEISKPDLSNGLYLIQLSDPETGAIEIVRFIKK